MTHPTYDLAIIGAGPAGSSAAAAAAQRGRRIALIERDQLGGTCHNYGCDPTKTLLHVAQLRHQARHAQRYGLRIPQVEHDWPAVQCWMQQVLEQMQGGSDAEARKSWEEQGVEVVMDEARFVSPHELRVGSRTLRAERIIIATGTAAAVPDIDGLRAAGYLTNKDAVSLAQLPKRLAIVGGGPLGVEFAQLFNRFGVQVTIIEQDQRVASTEDRELGDQLSALLTAEGIRIETGVELTRVAQGDAGKQLTLRRDGTETTLVADEILLALGRRPQLAALDLDAAGVETGHGSIKTDDTLRTNVAHIWAVGDIAAAYQFTHVANEQGEIAAHNAFAVQPRHFDDRAIPWTIFTDPELAHVGQTEDQVRESGREYRVGRARLAQNDRAVAIGRTEGLVKVIADAEGRLLGGHILAPAAGEMLAPLVLSMRAGLPVSALADTILAYPSLTVAVRAACRALEEA